MTTCRRSRRNFQTALSPEATEEFVKSINIDNMDGSILEITKLQGIILCHYKDIQEQTFKEDMSCALNLIAEIKDIINEHKKEKIEICVLKEEMVSETMQLISGIVHEIIKIFTFVTAIGYFTSQKCQRVLSAIMMLAFITYTRKASWIWSSMKIREKKRMDAFVFQKKYLQLGIQNLLEHYQKIIVTNRGRVEEEDGNRAFYT